MPYIINTPANPRPYITNNPTIYMDCLTWGWHCESRPFSDSFCKAARKQEESRYEVDKRAKQLEKYWSEGVARRENAKKSMFIANLGIMKSLKPFQGFGKHTKHDSVVSVAVVELDSDVEDVELSD
ncbi:uncharacterized protein EKO05_0009194 [Ascochyta rabiei]|uniref:Uncharacterized protein n=1 Tax=Didymella rabiei TaxID=5454 RepID=A0A163ISM3_DIDRA|nr:uncharacterized protein EKO05_0009194 [Ascochyta rabiei]KZM25920.1 hypothetical protein ST47_g2982 [Ascochyta rabiei]UPX18911.1 hypothetical protein EKO05_0009194 [Ascochyta rabiei]